jgi:hypothetical protein
MELPTDMLGFPEKKQKGRVMPLLKIMVTYNMDHADNTGITIHLRDGTSERVTGEM